MTYGDLSIGQTQALFDRIGGMNGFEKLLSGEWIVGRPADVLIDAADLPAATTAGLLARVGEPVTVSAPARFVARNAFVVGADGALPISYVGQDFTDHFLSLVEDDAGTATLVPRILVKASIDGPIFAALGGRDAARTSLAHLFDFLKTANRTRWYFFYAADKDGTLWAIDTYWRDGGWDMEAYSVTYPRGWRGGGCVVSR